MGYSPVRERPELSIMFGTYSCVVHPKGGCYRILYCMGALPHHKEGGVRGIGMIYCKKERTVKDLMLSLRELLKVSAMLAAGAVFASCASKAPPPPH